MPFGQGRFRDQRAGAWHDHRLLENHPRIPVRGLLGQTEVVIQYAGRSQVVQIESEQMMDGRRQRPWFRCPDPSCGRRCRLLYLMNTRDGGSVWCCRLCTGWDYACRHRHRHSPTLKRVRRGTGGSANRVARETLIARIETEALLRDTVRALQRRARRSKP
jgi:hypothetical protein